MRAELSPIEHAHHVTRRAELLAARPKVGGTACPTKPQHEWGSAAYIAEMTGLSKRAINRALSRGRAIPEDVQGQITGTHLDRGVYLDSIKGLEPGAQRAQVRADLAAPPKPKLTVVREPDEQRIRAKGDVAKRSARRAILDLFPPLNIVKKAWHRASAEDRRRIKAWVLKQETPADDGGGDD